MSSISQKFFYLEPKAAVPQKRERGGLYFRHRHNGDKRSSAHKNMSSKLSSRTCAIFCFKFRHENWSLDV